MVISKKRNSRRHADIPQIRYQFIAEDNDHLVIGFASGLTNHKWLNLLQGV